VVVSTVLTLFVIPLGCITAKKAFPGCAESGPAELEGETAEAAVEEYKTPLWMRIYSVVFGIISWIFVIVQMVFNLSRMVFTIVLGKLKPKSSPPPIPPAVPPTPPSSPPVKPAPTTPVSAAAMDTGSASSADKAVAEKPAAEVKVTVPTDKKADAAKKVPVVKKSTVAKKAAPKKKVAVKKKASATKKIAVKKAPSKKSSPGGRRGIRLKDDS